MSGDFVDVYISIFIDSNILMYTYMFIDWTMDMGFSDYFLIFRWKEWRDKVAAELRQSVSSTFSELF